MTNHLFFASLGHHLVDAVPELADRYEALVQDWGDEQPGPHVLYGDVLNPYLIELLSAGEPTAQSAAVLRRIFALLERMARDDDELVQEVVATTVLERLGGNPAALATGRRFMGDATRRLSQEVEAFWGADHASTTRSIRFDGYRRS